MSEETINAPDAQSARKEIEDFIQQINTNNFAQAEKSFKDMVGGRLGDVLDQQKAKIAGAIFNTTDVDREEPEEDLDTEEPEEVDLTPDDFEDEIEDEEEVEN